MKKIIIKLVVLCLISTISQLALASTPPFTVGDPVITGNGCPTGSYSVILSPDGTEMTLSFSEFSAMTDSTQDYDFSNCNIAIPIDLPAGLMLGLVGIEYQGVAFIPTGGSGSFSREHFFAGTQSPAIVSSIEAYDQTQEFIFDDTFQFIEWSECGDDLIVRSNATVMVTKLPDSDNNAFMSVFSENLNISVQYHLIWQYC